ncbi:MAG: PEP-CTERM sorting domain-containing protein [candidate division WS1 bacterium]|jgi:hypothetical protein|nr:PEP-CTERM sorting domain-containing protein [candidate division WS1 bacterium]
MKRIALLVTAMLLVTSVAFAEVNYHLYWNGTTNDFGSVQQGDTAELWVWLNADAGENVAGARYDVELPMEGWDLTSREYGTYGWFEEDGFWDLSVPGPSATPITINNGTWLGGDANTPDFAFNTIRNPFGDTVTGWALCEVFELTVPSDTPLGAYTIDLDNTFAYGLTGGQFESTGNDLDLAVTPEPASALLLLAGFGIVGIRRRMKA